MCYRITHERPATCLFFRSEKKEEFLTSSLIKEGIIRMSRASFWQTQQHGDIFSYDVDIAPTESQYKALQQSMETGLEENPDEEASVYEDKQKELQKQLNPIVTEMYKESGDSSNPNVQTVPPGGFPADFADNFKKEDTTSTDAPKVAEVD